MYLDHSSNNAQADAVLAELQATIEREIPVCVHMGIKVVDFQDGSLKVSAPLEPNTNPHRTGFAGSLNALCTIAGWGQVYLLLQEENLLGNIVIRRSSIKYMKPVETPEILARCVPLGEQERRYALEMFAEKGQAKVNHSVVIEIDGELAVGFDASYVVTRR